MKIVSYKERNRGDFFRIGCLENDKVIDLHQSYVEMLDASQGDSVNSEHGTLLPAEPDQFFLLGNRAIEMARNAVSFAKENPDKVKSYNRADVVLGTPIPNPGKIICVGRNYAEHAIEMKSDVPEIPVLFGKFANSLIGPEDDIELNPATEKLDYEVELVVVIGRTASGVKKEDALDYIAGYTIGNDTSARDLQKRTPQWLQGKTLDRTTPIGPWVVPAEEIPDPSNLQVKSYVNGELRQESNTSKFIFDIPYLIEFISDLITLNPGDVIMTGTPDGVGFAMEPPQFLQAGDTVKLEIEQIGTMENKIKLK